MSKIIISNEQELEKAIKDINELYNSGYKIKDRKQEMKKNSPIDLTLINDKGEEYTYSFNNFGFILDSRRNIENLLPRLFE